MNKDRDKVRKTVGIESIENKLESDGDNTCLSCFRHFSIWRPVLERRDQDHLCA